MAQQVLLVRALSILPAALAFTLACDPLAASDAETETEPCAVFEADAARMPPDARRALKTILETCSATMGRECKDAMAAFDLRYGDRFRTIRSGVRTWSLLEQRAKIREQLQRNFERTPHLKQLEACLRDVHRTGN